MNEEKQNRQEKWHFFLCKWCQLKTKWLLLGLSAAISLCLLWAPGWPDSKPPDTDWREASSCSVTCEYECFLSSHEQLKPFGTQKENSRMKKAHIWRHRTGFPAYFEFMCVCVCATVCGRLDRSDRGLIFYSWKWCPHPAISVTQSHCMSITGFGGLEKKTPKGKKKHFVKRMFFMFGVAGRLACQWGKWWEVTHMWLPMH